MIQHKWITLFCIVVLGIPLWFYWNSINDSLFTDPTSTVLEDKLGNLLGARIAGDGQWRFPYNEELPDKFEKAIIQFEDRDFYSHPGFSIKAFIRAFIQNVRSKRVVSGGSTLTMQVVRLMRKGQGRTVWEKVIEVILATRIELSYNKKEILGLYASNAPFGGNVVGLDAASWRYFGRSAHQLSWAESATLAVLPNAPSLIYPGKNQQLLFEKRNRLLNRLHEVGYLDSIGLQLAIAEPLPGTPHQLPQAAPHLLNRTIQDGHLGDRVVTTLDEALQKQVTGIVDRHQRYLSDNEIYNAAALVINVQSNEVEAYVGNASNSAAEHGGRVDVIKAPRSTGSILKPFLYASMLDDGKITPEMIIPDVPTNYSGYSPKNYSSSYDGAVPAKRALARSLNVPAVRMLENYGIKKFHRQLKNMGMTTLNNPAEHYGLSLILGGAEASLWDLAGIYAAMAHTLNTYPETEISWNNQPFYYAEEKEKKQQVDQVLNPASIWFTFEAMLDVTRPNNEINWRAFSSSQKVAWKTGTSFGFRDAWAIGVTPNHVVAVWVGNADGEGRPGLTGIHAAAPILFDIINRLPSSDWFDPPYDEMAQVSLCHASGYRASDICDVRDKVWIPVTALKTTACPYHQLVHTDPQESWRVHSECEPVGNIKTTPWFVLPPAMEWYYKFNHPKYKSLPPYRSDCGLSESENAMYVLYPKRPSRIYIPVELDGDRGKTVFEITHRKRSTQIHWHLDNKYLGSTMDIHQMELLPDEGKHRLTLVDEYGNTLSQSFEIIGKEE